MGMERNGSFEDLHLRIHVEERGDNPFVFICMQFSGKHDQNRSARIGVANPGSTTDLRGWNWKFRTLIRVPVFVVCTLMYIHVSCPPPSSSCRVSGATTAETVVLSCLFVVFFSFKLDQVV